MAGTRYHTGAARSSSTLPWALLTCRQQSLGWEHYEVHEPEPHILLFKSVSSILPCPSFRWGIA